MPRKREHSQPTRQIYASIREDIYLAAKTRASELRMPMRRFIEEALANAIKSDIADLEAPPDSAPQSSPSIWDDQRINAQARQPVGSPIDLSEEEARRIALGAFISLDASATDDLDHHSHLVSGNVGDPFDFSDDDAAQFVREALTFGAFGSREASDG